MKPFFCLLLILSFAGTRALADPPPTIGSKFKRSWKSAESQLCMTSSAQLDPCVQRTFDGITYTIAYREQTHRVSYVYTNDKNFRTADGLKVGDSIPVSKETVFGEPGWQSFAPSTRDGWLPIVGFDGLRITLKDGTVIDLTGSEGIKSGMAEILGFARSRR